jgi:hypothetical protein
MEQREYLQYYKAKTLNVNVLDKLHKKTLSFQGTLDDAIKLAKRNNRVYRMERDYRGFLKGKAKWVADHYQLNIAGLSLLKGGYFTKMNNGIERGYKKYNKYRYVYRVNNRYYVAANLKSLKTILEKEKKFIKK